VDLEQLAKAKNIVSDARASLSELCIKTLSCVLPKDLNTCISTDWSADELTEDQIQYAALDAWASLKIYEKLNSLQIPAPVDFNSRLPAEYQVFIYQQDRTTIIARGIISPDSFQSFEGINITRTRVLIQVNDVYVPGAIISLHRDQSLSSFGEPPLNFVCRKSQIKTFVEDFIPLPSLSPALSISTHSTEDLDPLAELGDSGPPSSLVQSNHSDLENLNISFSDVNALPPTLSDSPSGAIDQAAVEGFFQLLNELTAMPWAPAIRSGVLKDIFHVFQMIYIPKSHGLCVTFSQALRDAIFLPDAEDKKRIVSFLACQNPPMTWNECLQSNPQFIKKALQACCTSP